MSKRASYILILSVVAVTIAVLVFGMISFSSGKKFADEKTVVIGENTQTEMEVSLTGFYPGASKSYQIHMKANKGDKFKVTMDFEKTGEGSLAKFVDVEVIVDGEQADKAKLAEYLDGREISFSAEFEDTKTVEVEIVYSMATTVGDEAQNTAADFDIKLSSER